jgi:hypothetical protein
VAHPDPFEETADRAGLSGDNYRFLFNRSLNALLARKAGTVEALMLAGFPVRGSRHSRAARFRDSKLPNPEIETLPPRLSSEAMIPFGAKKISAISWALALVRPSRLATASMSCCLFKRGPWRERYQTDEYGNCWSLSLEPHEFFTTETLRTRGSGLCSEF